MSCTYKKTTDIILVVKSLAYSYLNYFEYFIIGILCWLPLHAWGSAAHTRLLSLVHVCTPLSASAQTLSRILLVLSLCEGD